MRNLTFNAVPKKKKAIEQFIFEFPLIFPTNVCLKKYNKKRLVTVIV